MVLAVCALCAAASYYVLKWERPPAHRTPTIDFSGR